MKKSYDRFALKNLMLAEIFRIKYESLSQSIYNPNAKKEADARRIFSRQVNLNASSTPRKFLIEIRKLYIEMDLESEFIETITNFKLNPDDYKPN